MQPTDIHERRVTTESAGPTDRPGVVALWRSCGLVVPHNPPEADFDRALGQPGSDVLVLRQGGRIAGSVMVGHDGHRGWLYYLAVHPDFQRQGLGAHLVSAAETWLQKRDIRKVQLMVRDSNQEVLEFYRRIGYETAPVTVMQRWLTDPAPGDSP